MLAHLVAALLCANAVTLDATTKTIEITTGAAVSTDYVVSYVDGASGAYAPGTSQGNVATATTTTILAAPAASTQRAVSMIAITNRGTATQTVQVKLDVSATEYAITPVLSLPAGFSARIENDAEVKVVGPGGTRRESGYVDPGFMGNSFDFYKVGATSEAAAVNYLHQKDTGFPGAWVPGTPGLNGAVLDCSTAAGAAVAGSPHIQNPAIGTLYMTYASTVANVLNSSWIADLLWYNTGIAPATTTAQAITSPTWPARDNIGSTNGEGVQVALYAPTTVANAAAVTGTTISYTNSAGTAGRTGTMASWPQTGVAGTFVPFQLAAGDLGVRSVQSITLTTSYVSGTLSLIAFNTKWRSPTAVVNVGAIAWPPQSPGVRLYNGTCLGFGYLATATTATTSSGSVWVMER